ncbi:hypothetical protein KY334_00005, partial [Candidatus Woesearchaeota archaeon]|nr:hypothetical protein [Candidatus Woesearchaeota archaeon]
MIILKIKIMIKKIITKFIKKIKKSNLKKSYDLDLQKKWIMYRLADMTMKKQRFDIDFDEIYSKKYPDSIVSKYMNATREQGNLDLMMKIVDEYELNNNPEKHEVVVNLRVGEVINQSRYTVKEMLKEQKNFFRKAGHYVKPLSYYKEIIPLIPKGLKKIKIVAGGGQSIDNHKDEIYIKAIGKLFEKSGFIVSVQDYQIPDEDFVYLCRSSYLIPSGGGFSNLAARIVRKKKGQVITNLKNEK